MSESAATIIKIISALTSPKACIKYITIGAFYFFSLVYIKPLMSNEVITDEQKQFIILMIGLGAGSLLGHLISEGVYFLIDLYKKTKEKEKNELKLKKREEDELKEKERTDRKVRENITTSFLHLNLNQKQTLRKLTYGDLNLSLQDSDYQVLLQNNYILRKTATQKGSYVFSINPSIIDFIKDEWFKHRKDNIDLFMDNYYASDLLNLLTLENLDKNLTIDNEALISISKYSPAVRGYFDSKIYSEIEGFNLYFDWDYLPMFEDMFNKNYVDEIYIPVERIKFM
ncbi:hypothetical protein [Pseudoalteromonas lipolytica]|uniref:Uncharacterized protein n=1 Tax=Pseudoalteromonas lipolytica TaxID=570156 RepID=A0ABU8SQU1_9GAMM